MEQIRRQGHSKLCRMIIFKIIIYKFLIGLIWILKVATSYRDAGNIEIPVICSSGLVSAFYAYNSCQRLLRIQFLSDFDKIYIKVKLPISRASSKTSAQQLFSKKLCSLQLKAVWIVAFQRSYPCVSCRIVIKFNWQMVEGYISNVLNEFENQRWQIDCKGNMFLREVKFYRQLFYKHSHVYNSCQIFM